MRKDPRVNAKSMSLGRYLLIFLATLVFCGTYIGIYLLQNRQKDMFHIALSMFVYLAVGSVLICAAFVLFRRKVLMRPIDRLCEAARLVALGDFSIRLAPMRRDGKKDEFEVLFEDFNTMAEELSSMEMLKNDFVSNVSHELKTPLAVIQNYATILQSEDLAEDERKEYSRRIGEAADRLSGLVTNILQVSRLENQKIKPVHKLFNLSEALSRCILNYDALLEDKDLDLETDMDQDLILESDENLLDMVWNNLLSNAVKFTPPEGKIKVCLRRDGGQAVVSIADSGCGMDRDTMKHIFDKFYQGDTSHATQGNGLGLALVKRIMVLLDGAVSVESQPQKGTEFTVKLPLE